MKVVIPQKKLGLRLKDAQFKSYNLQLSETKDKWRKILKCVGDHEQLLSDNLIRAAFIFIFLKMYSKN